MNGKVGVPLEKWFELGQPTKYNFAFPYIVKHNDLYSNYTLIFLICNLIAININRNNNLTILFIRFLQTDGQRNVKNLKYKRVILAVLCLLKWLRANSNT